MKKLLSLIICVAAALLFPVANASAQRLKISKEEMKAKKGAKDYHATIVIESAVKGLDVSTTCGDQIIQTTSSIGKIWTIDVDLDKERAMGTNGLLRRKLILKSPSSSQLSIDVPGHKLELQQATYYYTVILPDKFPAVISAEWLLSGTTFKGFRVGYGARYGGYVSYKWGEYLPSGNNIDCVTTDGDLSHATELGYIRESIIGGARIGLFSKSIISAYLLVGGGYGKYGRQWDNGIQLEGNRYFYSDYISGFATNVGLSFAIIDNISISGGLDMIVSNGKTNMDFEVGIGFNIKTKKN